MGNSDTLDVRDLVLRLRHEQIFAISYNRDREMPSSW